MRESREIKFRGKSIESNDFVFGSLVIDTMTGKKASIIEWADIEWADMSEDNKNGGAYVWVDIILETIGQYTGLKDKNGKGIYEGDIVRWREPYRTTQTHTGDNIPNGSYTEPMEPAIRTYESVVIFKDGMFCFDTENEFDITMPLFWKDRQWVEDEIKSAIEWRKSDSDYWDDPDEGDKYYLINEYKLNNLEGLINYLSGVEIIGNIHDNTSNNN